MQEMSRLPLRILSKASAWPSRTSAGRTGAGRRSAVMPRALVSSRTRRASESLGLRWACSSVSTGRGAVLSSLHAPISSARPMAAAPISFRVDMEPLWIVGRDPSTPSRPASAALGGRAGVGKDEAVCCRGVVSRRAADPRWNERQAGVISSSYARGVVARWGRVRALSSESGCSPGIAAVKDRKRRFVVAERRYSRILARRHRHLMVTLASGNARPYCPTASRRHPHPEKSDDSLSFDSVRGAAGRRGGAPGVFR